MEVMTELASDIRDEDAAESNTGEKKLLQVIKKNMDTRIGRRKVNLRERKELCKRGKQLIEESHDVVAARLIMRKLSSELASEDITLSDDELNRFFNDQSSRNCKPEMIVDHQLKKVIAITESKFGTWDYGVEKATQISERWPDMLLSDFCRVVLLLNEDPESFFQKEWDFPELEDTR